MEALPEDYDRVPADEPNPEQIYHDSRLGPDLQAALDSLPPEFRAAVVLCDIEGLSYEEIGATLGVKLGTVRSRIHRGRQALRDYLAATLTRQDHGQIGLTVPGVAAMASGVSATASQRYMSIASAMRDQTERSAGDGRPGTCVPPRVLLAAHPSSPRRAMRRSARASSAPPSICPPRRSPRSSTVSCG